MAARQQRGKSGKGGARMRPDRSCERLMATSEATVCSSGACSDQIEDARAVVSFNSLTQSASEAKWFPNTRNSSGLRASSRGGTEDATVVTGDGRGIRER